MAQCFRAALARRGAPAGLVNVVTGKGSEIGDVLTSHPDVNLISFTGGDTGLSVAKKANMVPIQMELGGKDACLVFPDADVRLAAAAVAKGGFSYSGQRCTAVKLVLAFDSVADELVRLTCEKIEAMRVGRPEDDADITALVSKASADFVQGLVEDAVAKGAALKQPWRREDNLVWPVLVDHVTSKMRLAWEEPFGPVVPVVRVKTEEEALRFVNESKYGLQGCVFTRNVDDAIRVADLMETGTVQVNGPPARGPDHFPFQGVRDSGIGSQGIINSIDMMTKVKSVVINFAKPSYGLA
jgi:glyceraldehyde-3-phosphate dehydrogenase (NADP+)